MKKNVYDVTTVGINKQTKRKLDRLNLEIQSKKHDELINYLLEVYEMFKTSVEKKGLVESITDEELKFAKDLADSNKISAPNMNHEEYLEHVRNGVLFIRKQGGK